jgi:hypothetical protein
MKSLTSVFVNLVGNAQRRARAKHALQNLHTDNNRVALGEDVLWKNL